MSGMVLFVIKFPPQAWKRKRPSAKRWIESMIERVVESFIEICARYGEMDEYRDKY